MQGTGSREARYLRLSSSYSSESSGRAGSSEDAEEVGDWHSGASSDEAEEEKETRNKDLEGDFLWLVFLKWAFPPVLWFLACLICMWLLHVGTLYYVQLMDEMDRIYEVRVHSLDTATAQHWFSVGVFPGDVSYRGLEDPLEGAIGFKEFPVTSLDILAATLPVSWFVVTVATRDLKAWTKVIFCNAFLAVFKGLFAVVTIMPDSMGWSKCKERLGNETLSYFRELAYRPKLAAAWQLLRAEILGADSRGWRAGSGMRFCSDMLYSGHTYFTCLYGCAFVDLVRFQLHGRIKNAWGRFIITALAVTYFILVQLTEAYAVIVNRFHYTIDVILAITMTLLVYGNGTILIAAKDWVMWNSKHTSDGEAQRVVELIRQQCPSAKDYHILLVHRGNLKEEGDVWVMPCMPGHGTTPGLYHLIETTRFMKAPKLTDERETARYSKSGSRNGR